MTQKVADAQNHLSVIHLKSLIIKSPSDQLPDIPKDAKLFVQLATDTNAPQQTELDWEPSQCLWKLKNSIKVTRSNPSFVITIICESAGRDSRPLGFTKLTTREILAQPANQISEITRELVKVDDNGPAFDITMKFSIASPLGTPVSIRGSATPAGGPNDEKAPNLLSQPKSRVELLDHAHEDALRLQNPSLLKKFGDMCSVLYFAQHDIDDLHRAISVYEVAVALAQNDDLQKSTYLCDLGSSLHTLFERLGHISDIDKSISMAGDAVRLASDGHPDRPTYLNKLGVSLLSRFERLGDLNDINKSILMKENAVKLTPDSHPDRPAYLSSLGNSLLSRFDRHGDLTDIDESISMKEVAVQLTPDGHPDKPAYLSSLGNSHLSRFKRLGDLNDINKSILMIEDAVRRTPNDHPRKPAWLINLGAAFQSRFLHCGNLTDLDKAISTCENAMLLTPDNHPDKLTCRSNLATSFSRRFEHLGDLGDIEKSISMGEDVVQLIPDCHPSMPVCLSSLGNSYLILFEHLGNLTDIDKSISVMEDALRLTPNDHPSRPSYLNNLGNSFLSRFEQTSDIIDIAKSISNKEGALRLTPDGHRDKPGFLSNLARSFSRRFEYLGNRADIRKSISIFEEAMQLTPDGHPTRPRCLDGLGNAFLILFRRTGDVADIDRSISKLEDAIKLTPDDHHSMPGYLMNLGTSFFHRFERLGELTDINKSISMYEDAMKLTPDGHPDKPRLMGNLGNSVLKQFERLGHVADINKLILMFKNAVKLTPDGHRGKPAQLNNLGILFLSRFRHSSAPPDIDNSISTFEDAVRLTPDGHPNKPLCLNNLANSFSHRFDHFGVIGDLEKSISMGQAALQLTHDGHPTKPGRLAGLGDSFWSRWKQLHDLAALEQAIFYFSNAASCKGAPSIRFRASTMWAQCAQILDHSSLLEAYTSALNLLPQLAWLGLPMHDRHLELINARNVTSDAAAAAIQSGMLDTAVEWLEQGRSIIWGQQLQLRTPVDELHEVQPELATQFMQVSKELEKASTRDGLQVIDGDNNISPEAAVQLHHRLTSEWEGIVEKVQAVAGFERFLLPKKLLQLLPAAHSGPVVIINVGSAQCDALILLPNADNILHLSLSEFTFEHAQKLQHSLNTVLLDSGRCISHERGGKLAGVKLHSIDVNAEFEKILSVLWLKVVRPVLDILTMITPAAQILPHIWWCPTGPLSFLPIHAAGLYNVTEPGSKLSEFAISSYTPTLGALIDIPHQFTSQEFRLLAVALPDHLPNTQDELQLIQHHAGHFAVSPLVNAEATVQHVMESMDKCNWVHFACHGVQEADFPTKSGLLLADERLQLSEIIKVVTSSCWLGLPFCMPDCPRDKTSSRGGCASGRGDVTGWLSKCHCYHVVNNGWGCSRCCK